MRNAVALFASILALGCGRGADSQAAAPEASPPGVEGPRTQAATAQPAASVSGTVLETTDAGAYTYLRLDTANGEVWAAINQAAVAKGTQVRIADAIPMDGFTSPSLKRRFERIYFGTLASGSAATAGGEGEALAQMAARHAAAARGPADTGSIEVAKAEGPDGRTVAEVHAQRLSLKDKTVAIRGQVVKFNAGILGRNWLHLRDGSGARDKQDDDITVTTSDTAAVGDVVLARGVLALDRDFGAGYVYPVIVQDAKLTR